jgi:glycosyltransferase involved in cell wall biosynthesis
MRVAFVTVSLSRRAGGLFTSVRRLAQTLQRDQAIDIRVLGIRDEYTADDLAQWSPVNPIAFSPLRPLALSYSPDMARTLAELRPDLAHTQGIWMARSLITLRWARCTRRPYLVTPRGMLDPGALRLSRWKKRLAELLFEKGHLHEAACIHALSEEEGRSIRAYGVRNPICVVPNGIDLPEEAGGGQPPWAATALENAKVLLYMGRLHPKKGLPNLLRGWAAARACAPGPSRSWHLCIAGWDQEGHVAELRRLRADLEVRESVHLIGPQFGAAKDAALRRASAFILPSRSEGLPMAVLEAFAYRLPVLMTPACNLEPGFSAGAALRIDPEPASIADGLECLFELNRSDATAMGVAGRKLVETRYCWKEIGAQMRAVYDWILGGGASPATVRLV